MYQLPRGPQQSTSDGWLMQQKYIFSQFWRVEVWDQNVFKVDFFWCLLLDWRLTSPLCLHMVFPLHVCVYARSVMTASLLPHGLYLPGSSVHGIFMARILEWIAVTYSRGSSWPRDETHNSGLSHIDKRGLYHWCHLGSPVCVLISYKDIVQKIRASANDLLFTWWPL